MGKREIVKTFGSSDRDEIIIDYHIFAAETDEALERAQLQYEAWGPDGEPETDGIIYVDMSAVPSTAEPSEPAHLCSAPQDLAAARLQHYEWCRTAEQEYRLKMTEPVIANPAAFWRAEILPSAG